MYRRTSCSISLNLLSRDHILSCIPADATGSHGGKFSSVVGEELMSEAGFQVIFDRLFGVVVKLSSVFL